MNTPLPAWGIVTENSCPHYSLNDRGSEIRSKELNKQNYF